MKYIIMMIVGSLFSLQLQAGVHKSNMQYDIDVNELKYINISSGTLNKIRLVYKKGLEQARYVVYAVGDSKSNADKVLNHLVERDEASLDIRYNVGNYSCSMTRKNGKLKKVKGGCLTKGVLVLPSGLKAEVYFKDKLISKSFFPMEYGLFIEKLDDASFSEEKLKVLEQFVQSYLKTKVKLELLAENLNQILEEFSFDDEKFVVLKKVHKYVTDRENLELVIEEQFSYFDQDKARKIVGLPTKN